MAVLAALFPFSEPSTATIILLIATDIPGSGIDESGGIGDNTIGSVGVMTILGRLMNEAMTIPVTQRTAEPRNAYRNPSTVADAGLTDGPRAAVTMLTIVTAMARPTELPTCLE